MENILSLINKWLYSIVSNKRNSIDADKFDYILRDAYNVGIKNIFFDVKRLINSSRIVNDDLAFHHKNQSNLYGLFLSRYKLYKEVYRDRTCTAIDFMMNDMLLQAHPYFKFDEIINNPKNYSKLTDNYVLTKIENNDDEWLISANKILDKIKWRELYKFVAELLLNPLNFALQLEKINVQDIINWQKGDGSLQQKDIRLSIFDIDFGLEEKNPVQNVIFYTDKNLRKAKEDKNFSAFYIEEDQFGLLTPSLFKETCVRIYVTDEIKLDDAREAFIIYWNKVFGLTPNY